MSDILTELLSTGVLLGDEGRGRALYQTARDYTRELAEYLAPLHLDLVPDPERLLLQARPVPGDCGLTVRFSKAETLVVLTLWRIYDEQRLQQTAAAVMITVDGLFQHLKLYFEQIAPPSEGQIDRILGKLKRLRLVRMEPGLDEQRFSEALIEILPTLPRVIPFENTAAWEQQAAVYRGETGVAPAAEAGAVVEEE